MLTHRAQHGMTPAHPTPSVTTLKVSNNRLNFPSIKFLNKTIILNFFENVYLLCKGGRSLVELL